MGEGKHTVGRGKRGWRKGVRNSSFQRWLKSVRGNLATFHMTYPNNSQWNARTFQGVIVSSGADYVVIMDEATGRTEMLLYRNLDYVTIDLIN
ncbi:Spore coat protein GerQ [compost metagenome]